MNKEVTMIQHCKILPYKQEESENKKSFYCFLNQVKAHKFVWLAKNLLRYPCGTMPYLRTNMEWFRHEKELEYPFLALKVPLILHDMNMAEYMMGQMYPEEIKLGLDNIHVFKEIFDDTIIETLVVKAKTIMQKKEKLSF